MSNVVYPGNIVGLMWPVLKQRDTPNTIIQSSPGVSELRIAQTVNPIWHWTLMYEWLFGEFLGSGNAQAYAAATDIQYLQEFTSARQGTYDDFLFDDLSDDSVGPALLSTAWTPYTRYWIGASILDSANHWQQVTSITTGYTGTTAPTFNHAGGTTTDGGVTWTDRGAGYSGGVPNTGGGYNGGIGPAYIVQQAQLQLVSDGGSPPTYYSPIQRSKSGQFFEDITDLNGSISVYANGILDASWTIGGPGLALPLYSFGGLYLQWTVQPTPPITASFKFYFRVRFEEETTDFEQWALEIWTIGGENARNGSGTLKLVTARPAGV